MVPSRSFTLAALLLLSIVSPRLAHAGGVTYVGGPVDLTKPEGIAIAPADDVVFTVGGHGNSLSSWTRNVTTGELSLVQTVEQGDMIPNPTGTPVPIDGLKEARAVAVAPAVPDGTHVYAVGRANADGGLAVFKSAAGSGVLNFIENHRDGEGFCRGGPNDQAECTDSTECPSGVCISLPSESMRAAYAVAVNPEPPVGKHVYVASRANDSVVVFSRDATNGQLTPVSGAQHGMGSPPVTFMQAPRSLAFSADGANLYVGAQGVQNGTKDGTIVVFDRDTGTGALTFKESYKYNDELVTVPVIQRMKDPRAMVVTPDGLNLYVAAGDSDAVVIFSRAPDGTLTYIDYEKSGKPGGSEGIVSSADGKYIYATGADTNSLAIYSRDATTGRLLLLDQHRDAEAPVCVGGTNDGLACKKPEDCAPGGGICDPRPRLFFAGALALTGDKKHLYVTVRDHGGVSIWKNDYCGNGDVGVDEECDGGTDCTAGCTLNVCAATPIPCRTPTAPQQGSLLIKNNPLDPDSKDSLQFKWKKGSATTFAEYGNPLVTGVPGTDYVLCLYDNTGLLKSSVAPTAGKCDKGKNCWKGGTKYTYADKLYTPAGLSYVQLKPGVVGKAQIQFKGAGPRLQPPTLPLSFPVTVQVVNTGNTVCWGATFSTAIDPASPSKLSAKSN
jgi:6-phosphogluconolactonase (cycloisomerase 2 family)